MKRIAVCFSGHIRQWEHAKENQKNHWEKCMIHNTHNEEFEIDYFIHTWDKSEEREYRLSPFERRDVTDTEIQSIVDFYKPKKWVVDKKDADDFLYTDKWLAIFYGFNKVIELKRQYEIENNFEYDIVIKSRIDLIFEPNKIQKLYLLNKIPMEIMSTFHGAMFEEFCLTNFNDVLFYSSSPVMDLVSNIYFHRKDAFNKPNKDENIRVIGPGPGVIMKQFFERFGIQTPLLTIHHSKHGMFTDNVEIIYRSLHNTIDDINNPLNWNEAIRIRNQWFNS